MNTLNCTIVKTNQQIVRIQIIIRFNELMDFLANYSDYQSDLLYMEDRWQTLFQSLPWPPYVRPSFDNLPQIVPIYDEASKSGKAEKSPSSYSYIGFNAEDSSHPFSNQFTAPVPTSGAIMYTVENMRLALFASKFTEISQFVSFKNLQFIEDTLVRFKNAFSVRLAWRKRVSCSTRLRKNFKGNAWILWIIWSIHIRIGTKYPNTLTICREIMKKKWTKTKKKMKHPPLTIIAQPKIKMVAVSVFGSNGFRVWEYFAR